MSDDDGGLGFGYWFLVALAVVSLMLSFNASATATLHQPPLVGYGCDGANGALFAFAAEHFPRCESIEVRE